MATITGLEESYVAATTACPDQLGRGTNYSVTRNFHGSTVLLILLKKLPRVTVGRLLIQRNMNKVLSMTACVCMRTFNYL